MLKDYKQKESKEKLGTQGIKKRKKLRLWQVNNKNLQIQKKKI